MKTTTPKFATVAAFLCVSLCAPQTYSTDEGTSFDASTVLRSTPPVFVELVADNMGPSSEHSAPPPKPPPPKVRIPQPPSGPSVSQRIIESQNAAAQMAVRRAAEQAAAKSVAAQKAAKQPQLKAGMGIYPATKLQRQVAEAHARAYMAALQRTEAQATTYGRPVSAERRLTKVTKHQQTQPKKRRKPRRHRTHSRYIAVDTVKDKRASRNAKRVVMIWDTHAQAIVGNNVYDLSSTPPLGQTVVFETYSAEYVGTGTVVPGDIESPRTQNR